MNKTGLLAKYGKLNNFLLVKFNDDDHDTLAMPMAEIGESVYHDDVVEVISQHNTQLEADNAEAEYLENKAKEQSAEIKEAANFQDDMTSHIAGLR